MPQSPVQTKAHPRQRPKMTRIGRCKHPPTALIVKCPVIRVVEDQVAVGPADKSSINTGTKTMKKSMNRMIGAAQPQTEDLESTWATPSAQIADKYEHGC